MFQLLLLLLIVFGTYSVLTALHFVLPAYSLSRSLRGRLSLAALFIFTGVSHFAMPEDLAQLLPPSFPLRMELISVTGVLEILGAIGLLIPRLARLASIGLILFLLGVLPANIYAAFNYVAFGAHELGPIYLLARIPFQVFLMGWAYYFGIRTLPRATNPVPRGRRLKRNRERIFDV
jgi:uncharacterized membrane protein